MTRTELYKAMRGIVAEHTKHFASDIEYDIEIINEWDNEPRRAAWLVRESGTQFQNLVNCIEPFEYLDAVYNNMQIEREYLISYDGRGDYSIEPATRDDFVKAYNKARHYSLALYPPYGEPDIYTGAFVSEQDAENAAEYIKNKVGYTAKSVVFIKA